MERELSDATWVTGLLALCGEKLGGVVVSIDAADALRDAFQFATSHKLRQVPSSLSADTLTDQLDLSATLALGKPVFTAGLLTSSKSQLMLRRAEKLDATTMSLLAQSLDRQELLLVAAIDPHDTDVAIADGLSERLAFRISDAAAMHWTPEDIGIAQKLLKHTEIESNWLHDLCNTALMIGISSPRAVIHALSAARGVAALSGLKKLDEACVAIAARLTLAHRALYAPPSEQEELEDQSPPPLEKTDQTQSEQQNMSAPTDAEIILEAVKLALPANLLQAANDSLGKRGAGRNVKSNAPKKAGSQRGRRIGNRRATALARQRLDIIATLRSAAPWQTLRRAQTNTNRMIVMRDDFRVARVKQRNEATAIFAVDASGSTAFQRLAEAKGAVETILAECYVRRDRVALVAFRSKKAEVLLPPTRSLERAKRALASLPGGGGTPLAAGLDEAFALATQVRRAGGNPIVIILTDGRANITRSGEAKKPIAQAETEAAAKLFAAEGFQAMLIDVSPEPQKSAKALAGFMHATYLPMPRAGATEIARPITSALRSASQ